MNAGKRQVQSMKQPPFKRQPLRLRATGPQSVKQQRGLSLIGLIFVLAMLGAVGLLALKVILTYMEYRAISTAIVSAKSAGSTAREVRSAFDRSANVTYIASISGKDLFITRDNDQIEVSFAYEKKIPLVGPVSLVLDYAGSTARGRVVAVKSVE
jgi:type II secretory pathway pseudopilin PulG